MPPKLDLDIPSLARHIATKGPHKVLPTPRRIRLLLGGSYIADTTSAKFVWEHPYYPQYYLPQSAFGDKYVKKGQNVEVEGKKVATLWALENGGKKTEEVVAFDQGLDGEGKEVAGYVKVAFKGVDTWLEEDLPIAIHPKDPFKRIDILPSLRPITIRLSSHILAHTTSSFHLYETGLPVRYYMPLTAVDQSLLRPSDTRTGCPYKGEAEYYSIVVDGKEYPDLVWYYSRPTVECAAIQGMVCFYNEKVEVEVDGKKEER
ncbi:hypothetical protein BDZ85DRAFT_265578 [Elsinoe ampelina]|uniref:DUF427 domain-containing protein n=1 Tax=Elsinoe ampelina TaxID=302913 RepID=A0A6A6G711_9PEZI|nr:hypothetical protein BDZ85DRAFT_265578 [Elsinoe ampelina]